MECEEQDMTRMIMLQKTRVGKNRRTSMLVGNIIAACEVMGRSGGQVGGSGQAVVQRRNRFVSIDTKRYAYYWRWLLTHLVDSYRKVKRKLPTNHGSSIGLGDSSGRCDMTGVVVRNRERVDTQAVEEIEAEVEAAGRSLVKSIMLARLRGGQKGWDKPLAMVGMVEGLAWTWASRKF